MTKADFERKFYELWFEDQDEDERKILWYPKKRPKQVTEEFLEYLWLVSEIPEPVVVEIGIEDGHQRRFYEKLLNCRLYVGVDIRGCTGARVVGNSQHPDTIAAIKNLIGGTADIIFIDGNHSRQGVRSDYEVYKQLVRSGGFLAFHDTHHDHAEYCDGAAVLWKEIRHKYPLAVDIFHEADYMPWSQGKGVRKKCGIGVIRIP